MEEITQPEVVEEGVKEPEAVETEAPQVEVPQTFKVKHLKEEKEISYDEAPEYIQKGLDYDRVKSKYEESKGRAEFVENLAKQNNMSVEQYIEAVQKEKEREEINHLAERYNVSDEMAEELHLLRQERKKSEEREMEYQKKEQESQDYIRFFKEFPDIKVEDIPQDVFDLKAKEPNLSLVDAYIRHEYKNLKSKTEADKVNHTNAESTTGSVASNESVTGDFISLDMFEKNKDNRNWIVKNFDKISKSRPKW